MLEIICLVHGGTTEDFGWLFRLEPRVRIATAGSRLIHTGRTERIQPTCPAPCATHGKDTSDDDIPLHWWYLDFSFFSSMPYAVRRTTCKKVYYTQCERKRSAIKGIQLLGTLTNILLACSYNKKTPKSS